jgi:Conserved protein/domain typically associated with flavoprotein oxygenases, DIM6/NTAB family
VEELLKAFMRGAAQQVYAVTARVGSAYAALTATSVTSVSLRPPLMLVSIGRDSRHHPLLISADHIVVSMLGAGAERASAILAEPGEGRAKLEAVGYRETEWGPVIEGSIGYLGPQEVLHMRRRRPRHNIGRGSWAAKRPRRTTAPSCTISAPIPR